MKYVPSAFECRRSLFEGDQIGWISLLVLFTLLSIVFIGFLPSFSASYANAPATPTPMPTGQMVYAASSSGTIYALRADTGVASWKTALTNAPMLFTTLKVGADGAIYVSSTDGPIYSLRGKDGVQLWSHTFSSVGTTGTVAYFGQTVFVNHNIVLIVRSNGIYALNATTGVELWHLNAPTKCQRDSICIRAGLGVRNGIIYVYLDGLYALAVTNGKLLWSRPQIQIRSQFPALVANKLYVYSMLDNALLILNADTGLVIRSLPIRDGKFSKGIITDNALYYAVDPGNGSLIIHTLRTSDDSEIWHSAFPIRSALAEAGAGNVYITTAMGSLTAPLQTYALRGSDGSSLWHSPDLRIATLAGPNLYSWMGASGKVTDNRVYTFSNTTGKLLWVSQRDIRIISILDTDSSQF